MSIYEEYLPQLRNTTLFSEMTDEEIITVLDAMQPPIKQGKLTPPSDGSPHKHFRMIVKSGKDISPKQFRYDLQKFGEPGMLMGEVLVFSHKEEYIKPTPLSIKPPLPLLDFPLETLEFTPDMIVRFYNPQVAPAQAKMLRNMLGMLAQKVVDIRRNLFLERSGYDIYAEENRVNKKS